MASSSKVLRLSTLALLAVCYWFGAPANAETRIEVDAVVSTDLRHIRGEIHVRTSEEFVLVDPLSAMPAPERDGDTLRTYPFRAERGWVSIERIDSTHYRFHSFLPRRLDASGLSPLRGIFSNGPWLPQPLVDGRLSPMEWEVRIASANTHTIVLNGRIGEGEMLWEGRATRLSLAVLPDSHTELLACAEERFTWVTTPRPKAWRRQRLCETLDSLTEVPGLRGTIVDAPMRRRLVRSGEGQLFLSDRALRVSGNLWRHHIPAVSRGVLESSLSLDDPWMRALTATALVDTTLRPPEVEDVLGPLRWVPEIEALLHDGRLPFYSEVFDETWPGDAVRDDLAQMLSDTVPGRVQARRIALVYGRDDAGQLAWDLARGIPPLTAATRADIPVRELSHRPARSPNQDYAIAVREVGEAWHVEVTRSSPAEYPPETIELLIDDQSTTWVTEMGSDRMELQLDTRPDQVTLDPRGLVLQSDTTNDQWPSRSSTTLAFFPYEFDFRQNRISALAHIVYRPRIHGRDAWLIRLGTSTVDTISTGVTRYRFFGPLLDRRSRPGTAWFGGRGALLDPDYRPLDQSTVTYGVRAGVSWDTRDEDYFPLHGHAWSLTANGGFVPGGDIWGSARASAVWVISDMGRIALVNRVAVGLARGDVEHRLLPLGGTGALVSIPAGAVVGDRQAIAASEARFHLARGASLPLPLLWLSDIHWALGMEAGSVRANDDEGVYALGVTTGISFVGDVLGVRPSMLGFRAGIPVHQHDSSQQASGAPQLVVRFSQPF